MDKKNKFNTKLKNLDKSIKDEKLRQRHLNNRITSTISEVAAL